jgi:DNA-binding NarL/FixJ family response regulator
MSPAHALGQADDAEGLRIADMLPDTPRILVADDHPLFRLALGQALHGVVPGALIREADSLGAVRRALAAEPDTDLVLLDLHMPGSHGLMGLAALRAEYPAIAVVMISAHDDPAVIRRALDYGAAGFISKRADLAGLELGLRTVLACEEYIPPELHGAVDRAQVAAADRDLAARLASLTPQQFRVLQRVAEGSLNKQIAAELGFTERTAKAHMSAIFEKLGVRNRTQAGVLLRTLELSDPDRAPL